MLFIVFFVCRLVLNTPTCPLATPLTTRFAKSTPFARIPSSQPRKPQEHPDIYPQQRSHNLLQYHDQAPMSQDLLIIWNTVENTLSAISTFNNYLGNRSMDRNLRTGAPLFVPYMYSYVQKASHGLTRHGSQPLFNDRLSHKAQRSRLRNSLDLFKLEWKMKANEVFH